jgi:hypothetical protein
MVEIGKSRKVQSHVIRRGAPRTIVDLAFRQEADIADLECEVLLRQAQFLQDCLVCWRGAEVDHFIGILLQVVKLLRHLGIPELVLCRG